LCVEKRHIAGIFNECGIEGADILSNTHYFCSLTDPTGIEIVKEQIELINGVVTTTDLLKV
jgi:hypothetical protein